MENISQKEDSEGLMTKASYITSKDKTRHSQEQVVQSEMSKPNLTTPFVEQSNVQQYAELQYFPNQQKQNNQYFPTPYVPGLHEQQFQPPFLIPYGVMGPLAMCMQGVPNQQQIPVIPQVDDKVLAQMNQQQQNTQNFGVYGQMQQGQVQGAPQSFLKEQIIGLLKYFSVQEALEVISQYLQLVRKQKDYQNPEKLLKAVSSINSNVIDIQSNIAKGHYIRRGKPTSNKNLPNSNHNFAKSAPANLAKRSRGTFEAEKGGGGPTGDKQAPKKQLTGEEKCPKGSLPGLAKDYEIDKMSSLSNYSTQDQVLNNSSSLGVTQPRAAAPGVSQGLRSLSGFFGGERRGTGKRSRRRGKEFDDVLNSRHVALDQEDQMLQEINNMEFNHDSDDDLMVNESFNSSQQYALVGVDIF